MGKFKVGDTVKIIGHTNGCKNEVGDVGVIEGFDGSTGWAKVQVESGPISSNFTELHNLELTAPKLSKNQRITALENQMAEMAELKLIVEQLRKNNITIEDVEKHFAKPKVVQGVTIEIHGDDDTMPSAIDEGATVTNLIRNGETVHSQLEFEGRQYKKVDRLARVGDVIVFDTHTVDLTTHVTANKPYLVVCENGDLSYETDCEGQYYVVYFGDFNRTPETVDVYELLDGYNPQVPMVDETPRITPNQLRAEIIEKAKAFIEQSKTNITGVAEDGPFKGQRHTFENVYSVKIGPFAESACNVEFIVNEEKRTVVALLRGVDTNKIYHRGIAKCMPGDVFNEYIGKAIALGRALGIDVSEFEQAVQPNEVVVGMKVRKIKGARRGHEGEVDTVGIGHYGDSELGCTIGRVWSYRDSNFLTIINDTNAIYNEVNE